MKVTPPGAHAPAEPVLARVPQPRCAPEAAAPPSPAARPGPDAPPGLVAAPVEDGGASHDLGLPAPLRQSLARGWAQPEPVLPARHPAADFQARRRSALSARFPGEIVVVPSGPLLTRSNDTDYPYRAGTGMVWLTGETEPDAVLVLRPRYGEVHDATLYVRPPTARDGTSLAFYADRRHGEFWTGPRRGLAETAVLRGIATAPMSEVAQLLAEVRQAGTASRLLRGHDPDLDAVLAGRDRGADARDAELAQFLDEARLVKDAYEVSMLQDAVAATVRGFEDCVRELPAAIATSERWIEGTFWRRARVDGNDVGYSSICAAGPHATVLHWVDNDGPVRPGELVLLDMGVENRELYTADVTRTLPVDGRFTPVQRRVYEAVLAAQQAGIAAIRPGAAFLDPHRAAMRVLAFALAEWGILPGGPEESLAEDVGLHRRYTLHSTSHMLGLDVHDCARARHEHYRDGVLRPGMVLTVEPGLYFQPDDLTVPAELRGIGVRIEDDLLVTADGSRNLSAALPREPDEVERWMADLRG